MTKINVTNNHSSPLFVAGVEVRAGATVTVDETKLKQWLNGSVAKVWVEQDIIIIDGDDETGDDETGDDETGDDRESLVAQANALGIEFHPNTGNKKLKELIAAAQAE